MKTESIIKALNGRGIAIRGDEIDTDRIIPARFLRCVTFDGLGEQAFRDERYDGDGNKKNHPMNDELFYGATLLVVNKNFGCGSSREHAPQAIARWGIQALIGESYADIFAGNCAAIGVPAVTAGAENIQALQDLIEKSPDTGITLDLETMTLAAASLAFPVSMPTSHRNKFLAGSWDTMAALLSNTDKIAQTAERIPYLAHAASGGNR